MKRFKQLGFIAALLGTINVAHAGFDTYSKDFSSVEDWKITAEGEDTNPNTGWCRAVGRFGGNEITILKGSTIPLYGKLFMSVTVPVRRSPPPIKENAILLLDGLPAATGYIEDVWDWQGGKNTNFRTRGTFTKIEKLDEKLGRTHTLGMSAKDFPKIQLARLPLDRIMKELRRCLSS